MTRRRCCRAIASRRRTSAGKKPNHHKGTKDTKRSFVSFVSLWCKSVSPLHWTPAVRRTNVRDKNGSARHAGGRVAGGADDRSRSRAAGARGGGYGRCGSLREDAVRRRGLPRALRAGKLELE